MKEFSTTSERGQVATPPPSPQPRSTRTVFDEQREYVEVAPERVKEPLGGVVIRELVQVLFPALMLALTIHLFLAQATIVYGRSMEPNLSERQRLIIDKFTYRFFHSPRRNDIIVIKLPDMEELLVKRIVGLPYETIEIENGVVYINNVRLEEPYPHDLYPQNMPLRPLGPLEYFVLGDNRGNSNDSRAFGPIMRDDIKGRVWFRYWPLTEIHTF